MIVRSPSTRPRDAWSRFDTISITSITVLGGLIRFLRLDLPKIFVFDEVYYAKDACFYVEPSKALCKISTEQTLVHPPLGKWLLGLGIELFGYDSFGWRFTAAVAGTITIALLYLLARKLLGSALGASIAAGLLAIDLLHFVQSRVAMLDIFVPLFGVGMVLFLLFDRDRILARAGSAPTAFLARPWRLAAGASAGLAVASKWSGGFFIVLALLLTAAWELAARRNDGEGRVLSRFLREESVSIIVGLLLVPIAVYSLTYVGRLHGPTPNCKDADGGFLEQFVDNQQCMLDFHRGLEQTHGYQSPAWSWIALKRPVSYYFETAPNGDYKEVIATASPFVWWLSVLALVFVAYRWMRRRDLPRPEGVVLAGFALTYGPWLVLGSERPAVFIFYMVPVVPFMFLALGYVASRIGESWEAQTAVALFSVVAVGLFVFYYPFVASVPLPKTEWDKRIWVFDHCDKPTPPATTSTFTEVVGKRTRTRTTISTEGSDQLPPEGWCWI